MDAPRFCYKYNKAKANSSKNARALLFINHENFF